MRRLPKIRALTEVELELMTILWRQGEATVNEVLAELAPGRKLAYTSVSTILRILEQKAIVGSRKEGRGHAYFPRMSKEGYEASALRQLVSRVFDGTPAALVKRLLEAEELSAEDLTEIRELLQERSGER